MDHSERGTPALRPGSGRGPRSHRRGDRRHGKARAARTALSSRRPDRSLAEVAGATGAQGPEFERDHPTAKRRDRRSHFADASLKRYLVENLPKAYHYGVVGPWRIPACRKKLSKAPALSIWTDYSISASCR